MNGAWNVIKGTKNCLFTIDFSNVVHWRYSRVSVFLSQSVCVDWFYTLLLVEYYKMISEQMYPFFCSVFENSHQQPNLDREKHTNAQHKEVHKLDFFCYLR